MSRTNISPPLAIPPAVKTNETASGIVMKYLIISGWVTVTGPPFFICSLKRGITDPFEPKTFPNLTATNSVYSLFLAIDWIISSQTLFEAPMTLVGLTALSVDIKTNFLTLYLFADIATFKVPKTLFFTASSGSVSIKGTCLWAAAWKTTSIFFSLNIKSIFSASLILAISTSNLFLKSELLWVIFNSCWIAYAPFSQISKIINFLGFKSKICLQSSDPIEPPPPVTRTFLFFMYPPYCLESKITGSLPKRSSISTFLIDGKIEDPETKLSYILGITRTSRLVFAQISNILLLSSFEILIMEKRIISMFSFSQILGIS